MTTVEVVIPHHNRADLLQRCLESLDRQTRGADVCVADNASSDGTSDLLSRYPAVRHLRFDRNYGFGAAINRAVRSSTADVVIFLNNDAVAEPHFVEAMIRELEVSKGASVAGVLLQADGTVDSLGVEADQSLIAYDVAHGEAYEAAVAKPRPELLGPCGGAAAYRRLPFLDIGGYDENMFAYLEDVDLALRLAIAGERCSLAPSARVWHMHSTTLGSGSSAKNYLMGRSRGYLLRKYGTAMSTRSQFRGALLDGLTYAGQVVIDRNLGSVRGRLSSRNIVDVKATSAVALPVQAVPLWVAVARKLKRRAVAARPNSSRVT